MGAQKSPFSHSYASPAPHAPCSKTSTSRPARPAEASAPLKLNLSRACRTEVTYSTAAGENIKVVQVFRGRRVTRGRQPPREKMRRSQRWGRRSAGEHTAQVSAPLSSHCTRRADENTAKAIEGGGSLEAGGAVWRSVAGRGSSRDPCPVAVPSLASVWRARRRRAQPWAGAPPRAAPAGRAPAHQLRITRAAVILPHVHLYYSEPLLTRYTDWLPRFLVRHIHERAFLDALRVQASV